MKNLTIEDVLAAAIDKIKAVLPPDKYHYYSAATVKGYKRPALFAQLKSRDADPWNRHSRHMQATLYITYLQEVADHGEALRVIQTIMDALGLALVIENAAVYVQEFNWDFVGSEGNIPEISADLEWTVPIVEATDDAELIREVSLNTTFGKEG